MASGLMTLAYMIEMGAVFNLAYLELSKSRYIEHPRREIEKLKERIDSEKAGPVSPDVWIKGKTQLIDRLGLLTSNRRRDRQESWQTTKADNRTHYDLMAGSIYEFFDQEKDKTLAQHFLVLISALLLLVTVFDRLGVDTLKNSLFTAAALSVIALIAWVLHVVVGLMRPVLAKLIVLACIVFSFSAAASPDFHIHSWQCSAWWFFFFILGFGMLLPVLFILTGRRLQAVLNSIHAGYSGEFEALKEKAVPHLP